MQDATRDALKWCQITLAGVLGGQGKYQEAEAMNRQTLQILEAQRHLENMRHV
ncbi:hypothetical protein IQ07DRAFT_592134, partial [Pyrenochaeta sp. DS3sAY3a]